MSDVFVDKSMRQELNPRGVVTELGICLSTHPTRQLHNIAPHLAYAEHPASSPRAANTDSFRVCATTRKASVRRVRHPHPCEKDAHAPMGSKRPAFKGRASHLTRDLCNIRALKIMLLPETLDLNHLPQGVWALQ